MIRVCREQFIALLSQPILDDLSAHFSKTYIEKAKERRKPLSDTYRLRDLKDARARMLFESVPTKGSLDLNVVQDSVYFFN